MLKWKEYLTVVMCASAAVATGCAKQEFAKEIEVQSSAVAGFRHIPAKVDILIVPDNSASTSVALPTVQQQLSGFVNGLRNKYWDYHVAKSPIVNPGPISEVLVNPEFNTNVLKDGTIINNTGIVPANKAINDPGSFSIISGTTSSNGQIDYTYANTYNTLADTQGDTTTNFLRDDAMLAIIVITNGYEYSVDPNGNNTINYTALEQHADNLLSLKNFDPRMIRFYPIASYSRRLPTSSYCLTYGTGAFHGGSYFAMLNYLPGLSQFDGARELLNFCNSNTLTNVLGDIDRNLEVVRQSYVYSNIVLDEEPVESSIVVMKGGSVVPKGGPNGWEYIGGPTTVHTITGVCDPTNFTNPDTSGICNGTITPISLNQRSGYVIRLSGSARFVGNQQPTIQYEAL